MKVKKALLKDSVKEIKVGYKRFISILLMALLGVGFFAGLRATSPDMVNTIDTYFKEQNVYDIEVLSTLGLTDEDITALENIENVENVYGTYSNDGLVKLENKENVVKILAIDDVNNPRLISGNMPQNSNECVVEEEFLNLIEKQIGDTVSIELGEDETSSEDEETKPFLKETNLKIVGTVQSPIYISREKGTSQLGAGKIDSYIYVPKDNIQSEAYTEIYITLENREKYETGSNRYNKYVEEVKQNIENIKEEREQARYQSLIDEANQKISEAEEEFNTQKQEGESKLQEARNTIESSKAQITQAENEVIQNEKSMNSQFSEAEKQLKNAKEVLNKNEAEYTAQKAELETTFTQAEEQKQSLQNTLNEIVVNLQTVEEKYNLVLEQLKKPDLSETEKSILEKAKAELETNKQQLETGKAQTEAGIQTIENQVTEGRNQLASAEAQIESGKKQIQSQEKTLNSKKASAKSQIESAKAKIEESKKELEAGEAELAQSEAEFQSKIQEAEGKLIDAKEEVNKIENPTWYILDRSDNAGYSSFIQDTESIENLSIVFPIVFFAIAVLVSLTSMTRMVEEERQEIGTLKALGYNTFHIVFKYILYASLACIIGAIIGMNIGFQLLPRIIWSMYEMMYTMPSIIVSFNYENAMLGLSIICICIVGATIYAILREAKSVPATLLRPKSPKLGKRVLLERVTFIWKRLNFSHKVTVRNIFRYKKRFLMTIIGIFGCTSLILAGFGLKDSISKILPYQYENIFQYDMQVALKTTLTDEQRQNAITNLKENEKITDVVESKILSETAQNGENEEDVQIVIPESKEEIKKVINIIDLETEEKIECNQEGVIITDKLSELIDVKVGDTIKIKDSDGNEKEVKITNIAENYISHYIYMSKEYYENLYQEQYNTNVLFVKDNNLTEDEEEEISKEIIAKNEVSTISLTSNVLKTLDDTMNSLNYVVVILIVSAGLLAFVVLYNLSNVNISERIRELATIKVLGFYDREVYSYITRETILLTIIGIILGLIGGYFLNFYIIGTCEIDMLRFVKVIDPLSYLYAILITAVFSIIVNIFTYFALKKIDMISSLKSVE